MYEMALGQFPKTLVSSIYSHDQENLDQLIVLKLILQIVILITRIAEPVNSASTSNDHIRTHCFPEVTQPVRIGIDIPAVFCFVGVDGAVAAVAVVVVESIAAHFRP